MTTMIPQFKIHKHVLTNGLTVLTHPLHHTPRVEVHLWYNVGSKDEGHRERGMAHLLEHMMFKGTKNLSESDINSVCQKLAGDANAFTSQDYTCYTFRLPSNAWEVGVQLLAECMQHATFNPEMLASELKAVVEELRLYKDDYQGGLVEQMIATLFPQHPYSHPIIGFKTDLCNLNRDDLYAFYKKHYHPGNAVLVVTGDVKADDVLAAAQKHFGHIPPAQDYKKETLSFQEDLVINNTVLYRPTTTPWYCYMYKVPGFKEKKNHVLDIVSGILAGGKSSRLYQRLVNKEACAVDVECSVYDFFDKGLLSINVWPANGVDPALIEGIIEEELSLLRTHGIHDWEFAATQKRTLIDFTSLLESIERQAFVIGNSYLATEDTHFIEHYVAAIAQVSKHDIQDFFKVYLTPTKQHKGYLLPITDQHDMREFADQQQRADELEARILQQHQRSLPVEEPRLAQSLVVPKRAPFSFPKPKVHTLSNGLELVYHHNPQIPQIICLLSFKANHLYEAQDQAGAFGFLLRVMTDSTKDHDADAFAQLLETEGISLGASGDGIVIRCLSADFAKALQLLASIVRYPSLRKKSIEKVRQQIVSELDEFWDSPIDFIDQIAKELVYGQHPYHKNALGSKPSINHLQKDDLVALYNQLISPQQAVMVVVGDLSAITMPSSIETILGGWHGPKVHDLVYPPLPPFKPQLVSVPINRDQTVIGVVAPSISRRHPDYNALSILDIIVTGGAVSSPSSRLFQLREQSGLFYAIGGSLTYGAYVQPGMVFIKTSVATKKADLAQKMILGTFDTVAHHGVTNEEFATAKNLLLSASIELFESNLQQAHTFLFLKKLNLNFNLFDKQGELLSILRIAEVDSAAKQYCNPSAMAVLHVGRIEEQKMSLRTGESLIPIKEKRMAIKKKAVKKAAPKRKVAKKAAPKRKVVKKAAPKRKVAKKAAPKKKAAKKAAPKRKVAKKAAPKRKAAKKAAKKVGMRVVAPVTAAAK